MSKFNVSCKTKKLEIWDQQYLIWIFLDKNVKKTIIIFETGTVEFVQVKNSHVKPKTNNFGSTVPIIWVNLG